MRVGVAGQVRALRRPKAAKQDDGHTTEGFPRPHRAHEVEGAPVGEDDIDVVLSDGRTLRTSAIARAARGEGRIASREK